MSPSLPFSDSISKCALPFLGPNGDVVFFDVQSADPGTFTVPGVVDLETYQPGSIVETSWIFFKGDPQAGPQPHHPYERPFNASVKFSIDLVREDDTSKVLREIMPPTNASLFWKGGAPFGRPSNHSMYIPRLDSSCEYYFIGEMIYRWVAPKDLEPDKDFRLKLTTDTPPTSHVSGKLRLSETGAQSASSTRLERSEAAEISNANIAGVALAATISLLFLLWAIVRVRRRSKQIAL